eukprot:1192576-Prorocentrum_minimum.AAC.1
MAARGADAPPRPGARAHHFWSRHKHAVDAPPRPPARGLRLRLRGHRVAPQPSDPPIRRLRTLRAGDVLPPRARPFLIVAERVPVRTTERGELAIGDESYLHGQVPRTPEARTGS